MTRDLDSALLVTAYPCQPPSGELARLPQASRWNLLRDRDVLAKVTDIVQAR